MPMSQSALERRNPPPRRKSCAACIRSKRRCNLAQPTCSRCSHRMVECVYPSGQVDTTSHGRCGAELDSFEPRRDPVAEQLETCLSDFDIFSRAGYDFDTGTLDFLFDIPATPYHFNCAPLAASNTIDQRHPDNFPNFALSRDPPMDPGRGVPGFHVTCKRFKYTLEAIMNAPKQMAHENALPWCHPQLYRDAMPRAMQDAQACSALYAARNRANAAAVRRIIEARASDLIATLPPPAPVTETETSTPTPTLTSTSTSIPTAAVSPLDTLARAHALILYQIMRLFDGDPAAGASAEHTMPYLDSMAKALAPVAAEDQPGPFLDSEDNNGQLVLPLYPLAGTRAFWEEWIVRESARRTLLLMKILWLMYRLMQSGAPILCDKNGYARLTFTASAHLWQATDAVEFALA